MPKQNGISPKALDDAYQKFNQMVGLLPQDRPVLVDSPELSPLEVSDLMLVNAIVTSSPRQAVRRAAVELAKLTKRLYDFTNPSAGEPYKAKGDRPEKAEITAGDVEQMAKQLRRCITAKQLEEQYAGIVESYAWPRRALRVAKVRFDVGIATKTDVLNAELALNRQAGLLEIESQHEILKMAFKSPGPMEAAASLFLNKI